MQLSAIPTKSVEIANFPLKDSRSRRLFILIDGKKSLSQIFNLLKLEIQDGFDLIGMMLEKGYLRLLNEGSKKTQTSPVTQVSAGNIPKSKSTKFLSDVSYELAKSIGPVASIIMSDFELEDSEINRDTCKKIIDTLVDEIDDHNERQVFIEAVQEIINNHS